MVDQLTTGAGKKADVEAAVEHKKTIWSYSEVAVAGDDGVVGSKGTDQTGNTITATNLTAGSWQGTLTFTIKMEAAGTAQ